MKTIALTTAALLVAAGSAFAANGSLRDTSDNNAAATATIDNTYTASVRSGEIFGQPSPLDTAAQDHRTHWGN